MFFYMSFNINLYLLLNAKSQNRHAFYLIIEKVLVRVLIYISIEMQPTTD